MKKQLLIILFSLFSIVINSQIAGDIDPAFVTGSGFTAISGPRTLVTQTNGKVILGGQFISYNNTFANRIVRLNVDGTVDSSFGTGTGFNNTVRSIALQNDGKIIVGGDFTSYNGVTANRIIRLNADGSIDTVFGIGFNSIVRCILVLSDTTIIIGGEFTSFNGTISNRGISINQDGSIGGNFTVGFNGGVYSVAIQSGKFIVGGSFTSFDGNAVNRIVRLNVDGTFDSTFIIGSGFDNTVRSVAVQSDGKVIIAGAFITYNASVANRIVRLDTNGANDLTFVTGTGFDNTLSKIDIQTDGKIIAGGFYSSYNGTTENNIVRLTTTGGIDPTFITGAGFNGSVEAFVIQSDGQIMLGGYFNSYNNVGSVTAIRLSTLGAKDITFNTGTGLNGNGNVWTMAEQADGKIITAGAFNLYNGSSANNIARLNTDGSKDPLFNPGGSGINGGVWAMALQSDGKIILGGNGSFTSYNGVVSNRIVRLNDDGTIDPTFITGTGFNSAVRGMAIQSDGKIIIGGDFTTYNGTPVGYMVRLLPSGAIDTGFITGTGFNNIVLPILIQSNGKILIGGVFTSYNGTAANSIISLNNDGTVDTSFNIGTGFDLTPEGAKLQTDGSGKIIVVGDFNTYNGFSSKRIIRLNPDGTRDTGFNIGTGLDGDSFYSVTQPDGKIMVGGYFSNFNGNVAKYIVRLNSDGSNDATFVSGTGFNNGTLSMIRQSTGKLIVSGAFTTYKGISAKNIIRLESTTLGVNDYTNNKKLKIFPNPVVDILNIDFEQTVTAKSYEIYDILGKKIISRSDMENQINVSKLSKGIYVLKANTDEGVFTSKFLKE